MRDDTSSEHYKIYRRGNTYTESVKPAGGRMSIDGVKQPVSGRIYGGGAKHLRGESPNERVKHPGGKMSNGWNIDKLCPLALINPPMFPILCKKY